MLRQRFVQTQFHDFECVCDVGDCTCEFLDKIALVIVRCLGGLKLLATLSS